MTHQVITFTHMCLGLITPPLGCYHVRHERVLLSPTVEIISEQGLEMGRPSFIQIEIEQDEGQITDVRVGGQCHFMGEGSIEVP